jgi:Transglycosylase SLT domain
MSQFSPVRQVQLMQQTDANGITGELPRDIPITPPAANTTPLHLFTDQRPTATTGQLSDILNLLPVTSTTGRIVRIPGSRKRTPTTEDLPKTGPRMSHRLRQGIVLVTILLVTITTLLSLAPLDNGQSAFPLFRNISDWVHAQQASWAFQAHELQNSSSTVRSTSQQLAAPPPMTLPKSQYVAIAQQDASNAGISPDYFTRQINQESGFNPYAVSPSGAEGIAQFEPGTAAGLGINPFDPLAALNAAAHLMANYAHNYGGDYAKALAAYNGGSGTVQYAINACGAANWMNCLPGQTRNYIHVIMGI